VRGLDFDPGVLGGGIAGEGAGQKEDGQAGAAHKGRIARREVGVKERERSGEWLVTSGE